MLEMQRTKTINGKNDKVLCLFSCEIREFQLKNVLSQNHRGKQNFAPCEYMAKHKTCEFMWKFDLKLGVLYIKLCTIFPWIF